ncbi:MAG TPA: hypothetical protein VGM59_04280, partial [Dongiaceae bacterium]
EVPGAAETMNAGTDDNEFHLRGKRHDRVHSEAGRTTGTIGLKPILNGFPRSFRRVVIDRPGSARP